MRDKRWRSHVPDPQRAAAFAELARRLDRERQMAAVEVDAVLRRTPREQLAGLVHRAEFLTHGALDRLSDIVSGTLVDDPQYAEEVAVLAVSIAQVLSRMYPRVVFSQGCAHAWRDLGEVRSVAARYDEAIDAFEHAEAVLIEGLEHDRAIVRIALARTYRRMGRDADARRIIAECKRVFVEHGDTERVALCTSLEV